MMDNDGDDLMESPDVEKEFPGLYASDASAAAAPALVGAAGAGRGGGNDGGGGRSNDSDFSEDSHEKLSKKDLLIGKKSKDKREKKDRGYAALQGESSAEEMDNPADQLKSPSKAKKAKAFKFPSAKKDKDKGKDKEKDKSKDKEQLQIQVSAKSDGAGGEGGTIAASSGATESAKDDKRKKEREKEGSIKLTKLKLKDKGKKDKGKDKSESSGGAHHHDPNGEEQPVFGVALKVAVERSRCHDEIHVPLVVRNCIDFLQEHGLNHEGIYKASGVKSKVAQLKHAYDRRQEPSLQEHDPVTVAALLKLFLKEMPHPLLSTGGVATKLEEVESSGGDLLKTAVHALDSDPNRLVLFSWLLAHLGEVASREKLNKMGAQTLGTTLSSAVGCSPALLQALVTQSNSLPHLVSFSVPLLTPYVPPLSGAAVQAWMEKEGEWDAGSLQKEVRKQESLLDQIHSEMNAGIQVSKVREEQLWEAQRILTQLKRMGRNRAHKQQVSQEAPVTAVTTTEDEFHINTSLQMAPPVSKEAACLPPVSKEAACPPPVSKEAACPPPVSKEAACPPSVSKEAACPPPAQEEEEKVTVIETSDNAAAKDDVEVAKEAKEDDREDGTQDATEVEETEMEIEDTVPVEPVPNTSVVHEEKSTRVGGEERDENKEEEMEKSCEEEVEVGGEGEEEKGVPLSDLCRVELSLRLEQEELIVAATRLQQRLQVEMAHVTKLQEQMALLPATEIRLPTNTRQCTHHSNFQIRGCKAKDWSCSPSEDLWPAQGGENGMGDCVEKEGVTGEEEESDSSELEKELGHLLQEHDELQGQKAWLVQRLQEEREACIRLRAQLRLQQHLQTIDCQ